MTKHVIVDPWFDPLIAMGVGQGRTLYLSDA